MRCPRIRTSTTLANEASRPRHLRGHLGHVMGGFGGGLGGHRVARRRGRPTEANRRRFPGANIGMDPRP